MTCYDYDDCDDGVSAWVIILIVVLILKAIFWTLVCYRYYRRRQAMTQRVTLAVCTVQTSQGGQMPRSVPSGQVAYSGPLAANVPSAMPVHGTAAPTYPPGATVPPPYSAGEYKGGPVPSNASAPPTYEDSKYYDSSPHTPLVSQ